MIHPKQTKVAEAAERTSASRATWAAVLGVRWCRVRVMGTRLTRWTTAAYQRSLALL
jgi:hypothetical protein